MTQPSPPLVRSGRRPCAGPGHQFDRPSFFTQLTAGLLVIGLAATLMSIPAVVAVMSMIFADRLETPSVESNTPVALAPVLALGRVLFTLALATSVVRTAELT
jgi:hypothetical protein